MSDQAVGIGVGCVLILIIIAVAAFILSFIGFVIFSIPAYVLFGLYTGLEFISTNILIALDKIFYPGFDVSPVVVWAFWGLVIGAAIQGYREMNIYGRKEKGVLIALAPVLLLAILKLISPPGLGSVEVYSIKDKPDKPVFVQRPSPPPARKDNHSGTRSGATSLALGDSRSGQIKPGSDVDYFKMQIRKSGVLTVYTTTTGNLDTRGTLQDNSGATLVLDYDGGRGKNFKIDRSVSAGTYYVKVESYKSSTGSYTIYASFREQSPERSVVDDHSGTRSGATSLALGDSRSGQIKPGSDVDYFKMQVRKSGVLTVYTTGSLDTEGILQNSSGATLTRADDGGRGKNFKIEQSLNSGTYYVKVESYRSHTGSYTIHASFREQRVVVQRPSPPPARKDNHSGTRSGATSLALGDSLSGQIKPGSDVDYFKVQVRRSGVLTVYTTGILDTEGILQNSSGATLVRDSDDGSGNNFKIEQSPNPGTYYIKVESYESSTGSYTIHASFRDFDYDVQAAASGGSAQTDIKIADDETPSTTISELQAGFVRDKAEQGDAWGQFNLGEMYAKGRGVTRDYVTAVKWYRKAAEQGHALGQNNLGVMYEKGQGVAQDDREAVKWYRKAAEQGHALGQRNLGVMYRRGQGVAQDDREAVKWYRKAAEQGDASAQINLGWMYEKGRGVAQDDREAVKWYRKAAEQGHALGQNNLGWMYRRGQGVAQDDREAVKWYRKAAEQGHASGQINLGWMYEKGRGVRRDYVTACMWYILAEAGGEKEKYRRNVSRKITSAQIGEAKRRARAWKLEEE